MVALTSFFIYTFALLLGYSRFVTAMQSRNQLSEAQQMALEFSNKLLPPPRFSNTIAQHLKKIRDEYPVVANIRHKSLWKAGDLIIYFKGRESVTKDDILIQRINSTKYAPVEADDKINIIPIIFLHFSKPYNPTKLALKLRSKLGIDKAITVEPNRYMGNGADVTYSRNSTNHIYTFKKGWGDCPSGCIYEHWWQFAIPGRGMSTVQFVKEWGADIPSDETLRDMF